LGLLNQEPKAQHGGCPPGHHWNGTRCVKDEKGLGQDAPVADERIGVAGEVPATEPKPGPGPVADADRQKPGQPRSAWNLHGLTPEKLEEALSQFKANVAKQIKDATGEFESKVSEAVASAMAEHAAGQPQIAADSVAHLTAKELVGAIIPQVMDQVRREIARARGDVDFYVRPQE